MGKVKIVTNPEGIEQLFKSQEMQDYLKEVGDKVVAAADEATGLKHGRRVHLADHTAICNVYANSRAARLENLEHNTLIKAVNRVGLPTSKESLRKRGRSK